MTRTASRYCRKYRVQATQDASNTAKEDWKPETGNGAPDSVCNEWQVPEGTTDSDIIAAMEWIHTHFRPCDA